MSEFHIHQPEDRDVDPSLNDLHRLHMEYIDAMCADDPRGPERMAPLKITDYGAFARWWHGLAPHVQTTLERNYRTGFCEILEKNRQEIELALRKTDSI